MVKNYSSFFGKETKITAKCGWGDNVAVIPVYGKIVTYIDLSDGESVQASSNKILKFIDQADKNKRIKAIVLDIDSFGGSIVAAEEITNALKRVKKPTIAVIRERGVSAAYMIATGAQKIYASKFSEVGSIGITMSYLDYSQQYSNEGIIYHQLSSGKFKDMGNPNKSLTPEEKELFISHINKLKEIFVEIVSVNRNLDILKVREMADGSIMTAEEAKTRGLIDEVGTIEEIKNFLKNELKIKPRICTLFYDNYP